jgi:hypothetical protein
MSAILAPNSAMPIDRRDRAEDAEFNESDHPRGEGGRFTVSFEATPGRIGTKEYQSKSFPSMGEAIKHAKEQGWHVGNERTPQEHPEAIKHQFGHSGGNNVTRFHHLSHQGHSPGALVEREHKPPEHKTEPPSISKPEKAQEHTPAPEEKHAAAPEEKSKERPPKNDGETWTAYRKRLHRLGFDDGIPATAAWRKKAKDALTADMRPEDWRHLISGLLEFFEEEAKEPEHADDCVMDAGLALDESVRTEDVDGRMRVAMMNVSKANVCPYKGSEIPQSDQLGLDPERVYYLYRDPQELAKAAPSTNGVQILRKHIPINSEDHQPWDVVGAMGTDGNFEYPYLRNSATFWVADDIEAIKSGKRRQISMGYHYIPIMEPGVADGVPFDGRMTNIMTNHFAMVEDGRAGPDVMVADEAPDAREWRLIAEAIFSI